LMMCWNKVKRPAVARENTGKSVSGSSHSSFLPYVIPLGPRRFKDHGTNLF
jgi:hypothetical protein